MAGCFGPDSAPEPSPPSPEPTPADPVVIQQAEWESLGIDSYRIVFSTFNANGMGGSNGDGTYTVTVEEGQVTDCDLDPALAGEECPTRFGEPADWLFGWAFSFDRAHLEISFDPVWHLPQSMHFDVPGIADEERVIKLIDFVVLGDDTGS